MTTRKESHFPRKKTVVPAAGLLLAGIVIFTSQPSISATEKQDASIAALRSTSQAFTAVAEEAAPSVVFIRVEKKASAAPMIGMDFPQSNQGDPFSDFFERFFGGGLHQAPGRGGEYTVSGQGSGFIISGDGYIMTNNHVVGSADKITVTLDDGREMTAKIVGTDPQTDLAVIKIEADNLTALPLGDSDALKSGEWVVAVGSPFGLTRSVTAGIVSAVGRTRVGIADYEDFIQTDAAINPGNSGGPLLDLEGRVVGINTAIFTRNGGYMGVGFAIPINLALGIRDQLIKNGSVTRGYLGVYIQDLTPELARSFGLENPKGILVSQVEKNSPASNAGLEVGDVIVALDGKPVNKVGPFRNTIALDQPGTAVELTVLHNGKKTPIAVRLETLPAHGTVMGGGQQPLERFGLLIQNLDPNLSDRLGYSGDAGVVISQIDSGSLAAGAGLEPGALITQVNRKPVRSIADVNAAMSESTDTDSVLLLVKAGGYSRYVLLKQE
jgi:serine protease Do